MKKILNKILNIPTPYILISIISIIALTIMKVDGSFQLSGVITFVVIGTLIALQIRLGSMIIKGLIGSFIVIYFTSTYTVLVMSLYGYVTQPFLLSLAAITLFLTQTYSKSYSYDLISKSLWSSILIIILVSIKSGIALSGYGFWIAEVIGLNILVIYIFIWRFWVGNSKKTKVVKPNIIEKLITDKYVYIYIDNRLDVENNRWWNKGTTEKTNAYPYIYAEVMKAYESNKLLVIVSKEKSSPVYDIGEVKINKSKTIPYLYMEDKDNKHHDIIMKDFIKEIVIYEGGI